MAVAVAAVIGERHRPCGLHRAPDLLNPLENESTMNTLTCPRCHTRDHVIENRTARDKGRRIGGVVGGLVGVAGVATGAVDGAALGAAMGSVVPVAGTLIGAAIGVIGGGLAGLTLGTKAGEAVGGLFDSGHLCRKCGWHG